MRKPEAANPYAVMLFEPEPLAVYPIETAARMGGVPRRMVLVYCKYGLISPLADPKQWGYWFTADAIRTLRRIADLRTICGDDLPGIAMILELLDEVRVLRAQIRDRAR
jgi:DNA-binding transcriptional MerR regulator